MTCYSLWNDPRPVKWPMTCAIPWFQPTHKKTTITLQFPNVIPITYTIRHNYELQEKHFFPLPPSTLQEYCPCCMDRERKARRAATAVQKGGVCACFIHASKAEWRWSGVLVISLYSFIHWPIVLVNCFTHLIICLFVFVYLLCLIYCISLLICVYKSCFIYIFFLGGIFHLILFCLYNRSYFFLQNYVEKYGRVVMKMYEWERPMD